MKHTDITLAFPDDANDPRWLALRRRLWPEASQDEHRLDAEAVLAKGCCVRLALSPGGDPVGFAEASVRFDYVNGATSSPVAFLEGLYVEPTWRRKGVARRLVDEVERWAAGQGCRELASDTLLENTAGQAAHRALGFSETDRVVYFLRPVRPR